MYVSKSKVSVEADLIFSFLLVYKRYKRAYFLVPALFVVYVSKIVLFLFPRSAWFEGLFMPLLVLRKVRQ